MIYFNQNFYKCGIPSGCNYIIKTRPFARVGKIVNLLPEDAVDSATRMVLVNALYFKGTWEQQFLVQDTTEKPFRINEVGTFS